MNIYIIPSNEKIISLHYSTVQFVVSISFQSEIETEICLMKTCLQNTKGCSVLVFAAIVHFKEKKPNWTIFVNKGCASFTTLQAMNTW